LEKLNVKEVCNSITVDPRKALNLQTGNANSSESLQTLRLQPNPAQSFIRIGTTDGSLLTGKYKSAVIRVYNTAMQAEKIISITSAQGSSAQISIGELRSGVYLVQLIRGEEILASTFIKE
jgi:hypothetical protein